MSLRTGGNLISITSVTQSKNSSENNLGFENAFSNVELKVASDTEKKLLATVVTQVKKQAEVSKSDNREADRTAELKKQRDSQQDKIKV
jgi:hypothetical protein